MKKILLFLSLLTLISLACGVTIDITPNAEVPTSESTPIPVLDPPTTTPEVFISLTQAIPGTAVPTAPLPLTNGVQVSYGLVSLVLPTGLANGISGTDFPRVEGEDHPYWELTPGHTVVTLEGYTLQGKFHQPQIYIYPALDYATLFPGAFESMHRLRNVMNLSIASIGVDQLPAVPFFNAAQVFASNIELISFQNGSGIRFLTEYAQYAASANNQDLFYHFQGFSNDGEYYIIAILPITMPMLAETSDGGAPLPAGGIPYSYFADGGNFDAESYYAAVTDLLNGTAPDALSPTINQLDALIQQGNRI